MDAKSGLALILSFEPLNARSLETRDYVDNLNIQQSRWMRFTINMSWGLFVGS
jgi:hypothetical protein